MRRRPIPRTRIRARELWRESGLGSIVAMTVIVLSVLSVSLYASGGQAEPVGDGAASLVSIAPVVAEARTAQLYVDSVDGSVPVIYEADIHVDGWKDRSQRILETTIDDARLMSGPQVQAADANLSDAMASQLKGRRVLASVTQRAEKGLPESGPATVRLVVLPRGKSAGLVIDSVVKPVSQPSGYGALTTSASGVSGTPAVVAQPVVTKLSQYHGSAGTQVTLTGTGFGSTVRDSWVTVCGARATVVSWSDTSVVFAVPVAANRPGYVGAVVGGTTSNGLYFIPFAQPQVNNITPREGAAGTVVTIRGSNFGSTRGDGWVTFAGSTGNVVSWSDTEIKVTVPKSASAGWAGVVAHGLTSNGVLYAPYGAPTVLAVSSRHLAAGDTVTLTGRNFGANPGYVVIGGVKVPHATWSTNQVTFTVPAGLNSGYIGIVRENIWTSNGIWVTCAPRLTSLSHWNAAPGANLTVTGVGFGATQDSKNVQVNGSLAQVVSWSDTSVTFTVPLGATSGYVGVTQGSSISNGLSLVVETPASIMTVAPASLGASGGQITITGSRFGSSQGGSKVLLGGSVACSVVSWSDTQIVASVPAGSPSGYVGVVKQGVSSNGVWLTVAP